MRNFIDGQGFRNVIHHDALGLTRERRMVIVGVAVVRGIELVQFGHELCRASSHVGAVAPV
jgi:hypothetical protein